MAVSVTTATERIGLVTDLERDTARRAASALATEALRIRDSRTADHCDDVLTLSDAVGRRLGLDAMLLRQLASGAQLHDIGKVGIPLSILNKPSALTEAEWAVIREHTVIGERILRSVPAMSDIATIVRHSHEHWDGSGYPDGLRGEAIPLPSRVILCADAFHAMRCDRPYRRGRAAKAALAEIEACAGTQFDPAVAGAFVAVARDARDGGVVHPDPLRKKRLVALLTALALGTGTALATIPAVRDAIKSVFAAAPPIGNAAAEATVDLPGFSLELPKDLVRPPADVVRPAATTRPAGTRHSRAAPLADAKPSDPEKAPEPMTRHGQRQPQPLPETDHPGRALGRDVPVPRAPVQKPEGGRTDPPALGLDAGPNGAGQPPSRSARDRSATR